MADKVRYSVSLTPYEEVSTDVDLVVSTVVLTLVLNVVVVFFG